MPKIYGNRKDGTPKGAGYFGELQRPDGKVSTELSIGVEFDGKETEIPSLVPTLDKSEIDYLLKDGKPTDAIIKKAVEHAKTRMSQGKNPFAQEEDLIREKEMPEKDDVSGNYLISRQVAEENDSPAMKGIRKWSGASGEWDAPPKQKGGASGSWENRNPLPGDPEFKQQGAVEDPWVDPLMAGSAAFGSTSLLSLKAGMKLMPSLGRAITSGVVGGGFDIPLGMATEKVAGEYPSMALPFSLITGIVSSSTIENVIVKRVTKSLGKKATPEAITNGITEVRKALDGGGKNKLAEEVIQDIQGEMTVKEAKLAQKSLQETPSTEASAVASKTSGQDSAKPTAPSVDKATSPDDATKDFSVQEGLGKGEKVVLGSGVPKSNKTLGEASEEMINIIPDKGKYAININMERVESAKDVDSMIRKAAKTFGSEINEARRGTITNAETSKLANLVGMTPEQLLTRKKGVAYNAEEAIAARRILVASADNLSVLAKKVQSLDATDIDKFDFRKALNLHYAIQSQVSGATAEAGRALQSFNIKAKSSEVRVSQIKDILADLPGGASTEKMAEAIASFDSPEQIGVFARQAQRATSIDMFLEAWINGLLSGPQTHVVNMTSNSLFMAWQIPERLFASGISKLTGSDAISSREAVAQTYGLIEGFSDGLKAAGKVLQTGVSADTISKTESLKFRSISSENISQMPLIKKLAPDALEEGGMAARAVDMLGETIRIPGRFLLAEDEMFKSTGYRMELRARAIRAVQDEGLSGDAAGRRIQGILSDPQTNAPEIHLAAIDAARYNTFTQPIESDLLKSISKSRNPIVKVIAPFVRTPTNILKAGFERSPLAPFMKGVRADITAGGARRDLALARMSLGSMVMAVAGKMAAEGKITGGGPSNQEEFQTWRRMHQPYSIEIGDKSFSYNRIEPVGMFLGLAADFTQIAGLAGEELQPEVDELAGAIVATISKNVTSKTWLTGLSQAIQAMDDPDRYGNKYVQNFVKSLVPSVVGQAERVINPEMEAVYSSMDALKARIPGLSADLPRRRDIWGESLSIAITKDKERGWAEIAYTALSPVYIAKLNASPIDTELFKHEIHIQKPVRVQSFQGVKLELTPKQYDDFIVWMNKTPLMSTGKDLKTSLNDMVQRDPEYKRANKDLKEMMIRVKFLEAKEIAKDKWLRTYPEYMQIIDSEHRQMAESQ